MKKLTGEDIACLLAIVIGGAFALIYPDMRGEAFEKTVVCIILIKIFW